MYSFCTFPLSWINVRLSVCLSLGVSILQSAATFYHKLRNLSTCPICLASLPLLSTSPLTFCTRRRKIKIVIIKLWQKAIMKGKERKMEVVQSCLTLCDPVDCSLPGFSIHGILQARILEWVVISFSRGSSRLRDRTPVSCIAGRCFTLWGHNLYDRVIISLRSIWLIVNRT